ncbi:MAG: DNA repair protein RecO [Treponema sp.]|nr:DNA repair protein RecO [Treponema sp.]
MGERNKSTKATVLSIKKSGENNRSVLFISPDEGLFYATLFGGPKSKLKSLIQNFYTGTLWLYEDEVKKTRKITDFDPSSSRMSFSSDIYKMMAANLAAELVIKTKCAGENEKAYILLNGFFDGLEASDYEEARLGTLRFLWRYISLLGIERNVSECCECSKNLFTTEGDSLYTERHSGFICPDCAKLYARKESTLYLDRHALVYLSAINTLRPVEVRKIALPQNSAYKMKQFIYHIISTLDGIKLNTLDAAKGIL